MRERVFGIETEYALIFHPRGLAGARPTNLELYRRFEAALLARVRTLPHGFSWLREKGGRFLENGGTFHYEATAEDFESGLVEMASPECRDPFTLLAHERAKDELVEELCAAVNRDLERAGFRGAASVGKNSVDSQGNTLGSHESYWVEDRIPPLRLALFVPVWLALWLVSLPVVAWLFALRVGLLALRARRGHSPARRRRRCCAWSGPPSVSGCSRSWSASRATWSSIRASSRAACSGWPRRSTR